MAPRVYIYNNKVHRPSTYRIMIHIAGTRVVCNLNMQGSLRQRAAVRATQTPNRPRACGAATVRRRSPAVSSLSLHSCYVTVHPPPTTPNPSPTPQVLNNTIRNLRATANRAIAAQYLSSYFPSSFKVASLVLESELGQVTFRVASR